MALVAESKAEIRGRFNGVLQEAFRSRLARNVAWIYVGQAAMYLAPLITIPYLTRIFGPAEWGRYSFALAFSVQLALLVDYGFGVTGTRAIAAMRDSPTSIGVTLGSVMASKVVLTFVAVSLAAVAYSRIPTLREATVLFWFAVVAGITQGLNFSWFLYGVEKIGLSVLLDLVNRFLVAGAMVAFVHSSQDAWVFFLLQTLANVLVIGVGLAYILRFRTIVWPTANSVGIMLRDGLYVMLSRCGFGIFTGVNTFLLGLYTTTDLVGQYAGAERIARVVSVFPSPISQALFPRISRLTGTGSRNLSSLRVLGSATTISTGALTSLVTFVLAPTVTRWLLGPGFDLSSAVLRILSPLPLLVAANQVLVYQILFPQGAYRWVGLSLAGTTATVLAGCVVMGLAGNPKAIALSADFAEAAAFVCLFFKIRRQSRLILAAEAA